eukprot:1181921-Prorocentrum_minimum.AAC.2
MFCNPSPTRSCVLALSFLTLAGSAMAPRGGLEWIWRGLVIDEEKGLWGVECTLAVIGTGGPSHTPCAWGTRHTRHACPGAPPGNTNHQI